ncbi:MAG: tetratricopeptide repeat protein [Kofleriaceae bacterium]
MRTLALVVAMTAVAAAAPDPKLLAKGRELEAKGDHAGAIVAYERYLEAAPGDALASAELGFAALQAKDLVTAEAATRTAITHAPRGAYLHDPDGRARGAALYNLGLIQEAQGKPKAAAASYKESQASRPSRVVREKLQKLDPVVAATADPLVPARLAGPFKDIRELCRAWLKKVGEDPESTWGESISCAKPDAIKIASRKLAKPFAELQAFQFESRSALELAIRLDDGWYHFEYEGKGDRSSAHCGGTTFTVKQLPLAATAPQLRIEYTSSAKDCEHAGNGHTRTWGWSEQGIIAIGVGLAGKPLAPPAIVTALDEWQRYDTETKQQMTDAAVTLAWGKDSLDVTGKVTHPPAIQAAIEDGDLDGEQVLGHHVLLFP